MRAMPARRRFCPLTVAIVLATVGVLPQFGHAASQAVLVERGQRLFVGETFGGNGRTCATCHRPENNYTIDPAFIATLPKSDPLFVAETVPALRDLDRPKLLRRLGLVSVHADGFDRPPVARAVPTLLGLRHTLAVEPGSLTPPGGSADLAAATGWSGDGAPGRGSLRQFARGAVVQHFTRRPERVPGTDFRLPTDAELRALEAFMLSLGRRHEVDITDATGLQFRSHMAERGRVLFNNEVSGSCAFCHGNAGGLNDGGFNALFDIGISRRRDAPAFRLDPGLPGDGGFGASPVIRLAGRPGFGDGRFNVPSVIEAADTGPYFHDHSAATLEDAVRFYTTPAFANSPAGQLLPVVELAESDVVAIAAMLRVLNARENIRAGNALLRHAMAARAAAEPIRLAIADTRDAIQVLTGGPLSLHPGAVTLLHRAARLERQAASTAARATRNGLLQRAIALKDEAGASMVVR